MQKWTRFMGHVLTTMIFLMVLYLGWELLLRQFPDLLGMNSLIIDLTFWFGSTTIFQLLYLIILGICGANLVGEFIALWIIGGSQNISDSHQIRQRRLQVIFVGIILCGICAAVWQIYFDDPTIPDSDWVDLWSIAHTSIFVVIYISLSFKYNDKKIGIGLMVVNILFEILEYSLAYYWIVTRILTWENSNNMLTDIGFNTVGIVIGYFINRKITKKSPMNLKIGIEDLSKNNLAALTPEKVIQSLQAQYGITRIANTLAVSSSNPLSLQLIPAIAENGAGLESLHDYTKRSLFIALIVFGIVLGIWWGTQGSIPISF